MNPAIYVPRVNFIVAGWEVPLKPQDLCVIALTNLSYAAHLLEWLGNKPFKLPVLNLCVDVLWQLLIDALNNLVIYFDTPWRHYIASLGMN